MISAFEIAVSVNGAALNDVRESDAPNAAIIVHNMNVTNSSGDVIVSVYPAGNRTYGIYINFNEETTLDEYVINITVRAINVLALLLGLTHRHLTLIEICIMPHKPSEVSLF